MKHWGDVIVVENGEWQGYDWHWADRRILDMFIGGPELALRHLASFRRSDDRDFYDLMPDRSGAVLDLDRRRLLFFGDDLMGHVPHRRVLLAALAELWTGFQVGWAYGGTRELAAYVGLDCPPGDFDREPRIEVTPDRYSPCKVISVAGPDGGVRFWPLVEYSHPEVYGPSLLDMLPRRARPKLSLRAVPVSGVHVDPSRKAVAVWQTVDTAGMLDQLPEIWAGWDFEFWEDRYEEQLARCGDALRIPARRLSAEIREVQESMCGRIFGSDWDSPAAEALELVAVLRRRAPGLAIRDDEVIAGLIRPSAQQWRRFMAACHGCGTASAA